MSTDGMTNLSHDNEFLMITPKVFGKVQVLDLLVNENYIHVKFLDIVAQEVGCVPVNIKDVNLKIFFINWNDIRKMVLDENVSMCDNNELLEFDF